MAYSSTKKKSSGIVQISICILTVILVVLIIAMMMIVSSIQGTARIVNYAGLVRGKTQRIVKFEISGKQEDDMIQEIESFIDGLRNGNKELNLVRLEDSDFQTKMEELNEYFLMLKQEIMQVRAYGADKTQILSKSEHFFEICDELEKDYVSGLTLSGGDPLHPMNRKIITELCKFIKRYYPHKTIWCYTGYQYAQVKDLDVMHYIDVLVDGEYVEELRDVNAHWVGSTNQKVIRL